MVPTTYWAFNTPVSLYVYSLGFLVLCVIGTTARVYTVLRYLLMLSAALHNPATQRYEHVCSAYPVYCSPNSTCVACHTSYTLVPWFEPASGQRPVFYLTQSPSQDVLLRSHRPGHLLRPVGVPAGQLRGPQRLSGRAQDSERQDVRDHLQGGQGEGDHGLPGLLPILPLRTLKGAQQVNDIIVK